MSQRAVLDLVVQLKGDAAKDMDQLAGKTSSLGGVVSKLAGPVVAAGVAFGAFATQGISAAADLQGNLNLLAATSGATAAELDQISDRAKALGADIALPGTSAADAAEAMLELSKAGLSVADTMGAAKGVLQLSAAGAVSNAQAAEYAANALNQFNLEGKQATMVADLFAATANASSVEVKDVADSMSMAGAVFSAFQGPAVGAENAMVDLTTAVGLLGNAGIKGSDAGTSLKQMLLQLTGPSDKAKGSMQELAQRVGESGDIAFDAAGKMRSVPEILDITRRATKDMTDEQRSFYMTQIFGADASRAVIALLAEGTEGWDKMRGSVTKAGAAGDLAAARMKGLKGSMEGLGSTVETVATSAMEPFLPLMESAIRTTTTWVGVLGERLIPVMGDAAAGIVTVAGFVSDNAIPAITGLTAATLAYATVTTLQAVPSGYALATALMAATNSALAFVAATAPYALIAAAVYAVAKSYENLQEQTQAATDALLEGRSWWEQGQTALTNYAAASDEVKTSLGDTATTLQQLMDTQRAEIEQQMSSGMAASQAQIDAWNQRAVVIQHYGQELNAAMAVNLEAQAADMGLISTVQAHTGAEGERAAAMQITAEEMQKLIDQLQKIREESISAIDQIISSDVELLSTLESNRISHEERMDALLRERAEARTAKERLAIDERIAAEKTGYDQSFQNQAIAYAQQQAAQLQHLGQMLTEYVQAQAQMGRIGAEKAEELTEAITREYGNQRSIADVTYSSMIKSIDEWATSTSTNVNDVIGDLSALRFDAVETQQKMDALAKQYTAELIHNFREGKISAEELAIQLGKIPSKVYSEVVITETVTTNRRQGGEVDPATGDVVGRRAWGGPVAANTPYLVGERGPELFISQSAGYIVPNNQLPGQSVVNHNYYLTAQYSMQNERELMDDLRMLQLLAA